MQIRNRSLAHVVAVYVCVGQAGEAQRNSQSISEELKDLKRRHDALHIRLVESEEHERREHEMREHEEAKRVRVQRLLEKVCVIFWFACLSSFSWLLKRERESGSEGVGIFEQSIAGGREGSRMIEREVGQKLCR